MLRNILIRKFYNGIKLVKDIMKYKCQCMLQRDIICREKKYVFMFHKITRNQTLLESDEYAISPEMVKRIVVQLLKKGFNIISPEEILSKNRNSIVLSFDDAYAGVYTELFPFFVENEIPFIVFQTNDFINKDGYLSDAMIRNMLEYKKFSLGAHTITHQRLALINKEQINKEIAESKRLLQKRYNIKISSFAYPYGDFVSLNFSCVRAAYRNYQQAFSTIQCGVKKKYRFGLGRYVIPRINFNEKNAQKIIDCIL